MSYKIAVGSTDGKVVNEHFGRCRQFLIVEVDSETLAFHFDGYRSVAPACVSGEHTDAAFDEVFQVIGDCRAVLVSKIGIAATKYLQKKGISVFEIGDYIEDAVQKLIAYYSKIDTRPKNK